MSPILTVPAGRIRFCRVERVRDVDGRKLLGVQLVRIQIHHDLALLAAVRDRKRMRPARLPSGVRMKLLPRSKISCSRSVLLSRPSCRMGTLEASYFRMFGGKHSRRHAARDGRWHRAP